MSKKSRTEKERELIQEVIKHLELHKKEYGYVATDDHGLYAYNISPKNCKIAYDEVYSISDPNMIYHFISRDEIITSIFKFPEVYKIEEAIIILKRRIIDMDYEKSPVDKLFKLLSEVQGIEIKPYNQFDIKTADNITLGTHYLDENFRRYYSNGIREYNEDTLRGILTGEMKILKCKKTVVLTEDDIICLKYYLKNGYKYITNYQVYKKSISTDVNNPIYIYGDFINGERMFEPQDELSFVHHNHEDIWNIEELLEQERVNND